MTDVLREIILPKLNRIKKSGAGFVACCPAHEDNRASLSIGPGRDQPVVLHCLAGETRVITRRGTKTLAEMAGEKHELLVPRVNGGPAVWQEVPISAFGVQRLMKVTLSRFGREKVLFATAEHRWFVQYRNSAPKRETVTANLKPGDRLASIHPRRTNVGMSAVGVAHGFTFGDGTRNDFGCYAQFCGPKDEALLPYFPSATEAVEYQPGVLRLTGMPRSWKDVPSFAEGPSYLHGWLAGYFAADGSIEGPNGPAVISSSNVENLEAVREVATHLGITTYPIQRQDRTGFGVDSALYKVTLRPGDLSAEFFIIPSHRRRWEERERKTSYDTWRVASIEDTDRIEEVYCATVPGSHAFALEDNVLTGNCHAGCDSDSILSAIGLSYADLSKPREQRRTDDEVWTPAGPAIAVYDYRDEAGELLYQVLRTANKDFRQRTPDHTAKSGWAWRLGDVRRVPYRLPQVVQAVADGRQVWITEGEKDVHSLEAHGLVATCNSGGAGKWLPEFSAHFKDSAVAVIADSDDPGRAHARMVRDALTEVGAEVEIFEAPDHKDVSDHLAAGKDLTGLVKVWPNEPKPPVLAPDLWEFLAVPDDPYDWIVPDLLERGDRMILTGLEGLGKSVWLRQLAIQFAAGINPARPWQTVAPARVLVIDCENSEKQNRRKYRPLAEISVTAKRRVPDGGMRLIHRTEGIDLTRGSDAEWLIERVTAHRPDVIVVGPLYRLHNQNINDEVPARKTVEVLDAARAVCGSALLIEAHAGHGQQGQARGLRPAGSSLFLRWPEFGFGLRPSEGTRMDDDRPMDVDVVRWRGERDKRQWPGHLTHGMPGEWPWKPSLGIAPEKSKKPSEFSAASLSKKDKK